MKSKPKMRHDSIKEKIICPYADNDNHKCTHPRCIRMCECLLHYRKHVKMSKKAVKHHGER